MLNNREWALLLWGAVLIVWAGTRPTMKIALMAVLRTAISRKILLPLLVMAAWVYVLAVLAREVVPWDSGLTKGAVVWFITAGLVLFGNFKAVTEKAHFFRGKAIAVFGWPVLVEFYLDLYQLPFLAEVAIQPLLALFAVMSVLAGRKAEHHRVKSCVEGVMALAGIALLAYVIAQTVKGWEAIDMQGLLIQLALPAWLTLGALPFIFFLALHAGYDHAFSRISLRRDVSRCRRMRSRVAIAIGMHFRVRDLSEFSGYRLRKVVDAPTLRGALAEIAEYRTEIRESENQEADDQRALIRLAGVSGVDSDGCQLDRREFEETTNALRWVGTCEMGWYKKGDCYRADMLEIIGDDLERYGLPEPPGLELHVSPDGQTWFAWRRTVTGWCFAIGAAGPPPDQWEYDGAEPPDGFPGSDVAWGPSPFSEGFNENW